MPSFHFGNILFIKDALQFYKKIITFSYVPDTYTSRKQVNAAQMKHKADVKTMTTGLCMNSESKIL